MKTTLWCFLKPKRWSDLIIVGVAIAIIAAALYFPVYIRNEQAKGVHLLGKPPVGATVVRQETIRDQFGTHEVRLVQIKIKRVFMHEPGRYSVHVLHPDSTELTLFTFSDQPREFVDVQRKEPMWLQYREVAGRGGFFDQFEIHEHIDDVGGEISGGEWHRKISKTTTLHGNTVVVTE